MPYKQLLLEPFSLKFDSVLRYSLVKNVGNFQQHSIELNISSGTLFYHISLGKLNTWIDIFDVDMLNTDILSMTP